jgi:excisionase family DNA binding protein
MSTEGLWKKRQAADYLGISINTINHWVSERRIIFVKLGTLVRFRKSDLDRFIARNVRGKTSSEEPRT